MADILDVRDLITRYEELKTELSDTFLNGIIPLKDIKSIESEIDEEFQEYHMIKELLEELKGNGGDEQWRSNWYPITLINENYFEESMDELVADCYEVPKDLPSFITLTIDYDALKTDYSEIDYDGETYYYR